MAELDLDAVKARSDAADEFTAVTPFWAQLNPVGFSQADVPALIAEVEHHRDDLLRGNLEAQVDELRAAVDRAIEVLTPLYAGERVPWSLAHDLLRDARRGVGE